jgi:hypothetical protein
LSENWDSGYGLGVRRLEGKLLREKSDAVASGFGVERVRIRRINGDFHTRETQFTAIDVWE